MIQQFKNEIHILPEDGFGKLVVHIHPQGVLKVVTTTSGVTLTDEERLALAEFLLKDTQHVIFKTQHLNKSLPTLAERLGASSKAIEGTQLVQMLYATPPPKRTAFAYAQAYAAALDSRFEDEFFASDQGQYARVAKLSKKFGTKSSHCFFNALGMLYGAYSWLAPKVEPAYALDSEESFHIVVNESDELAKYLSHVAYF